MAHTQKAYECVAITVSAIPEYCNDRVHVKLPLPHMYVLNHIKIPTNYIIIYLSGV